MKELLLICMAVAVCFSLSVPVDGAESVEFVNGVIANERVVNLPQDSEKWYISVVGVPGEQKYREILGWFNDDENMRKLKMQVHYRAIDSNTAIYRERYEANVTDLPMVRLQKNNGEVVYESSGASLPMSAAGLHNALIESSDKAQGLRIFRPWQRQQQGNRCPVCPKPKPPLAPVVPDPPPAPLSDTPTPNTGSDSALTNAGLGGAATLLLLLTGAGLSLVVQWRRKYR